MSSYYQNNASFLGFKAFDRVDTTYWASGELTFASSGVGAQWIQIEYPDAVKMSIPMQWTLSGSNNGTNFAHVAYKYWRITVTLVRTIGNSIHCAITDIAFNSGWSIGLPSLLTAQPVSLQNFKLIMGNAYDTPVDWQFNLMILKNSRIINSGLYNLSLANGITKLT
ncbi:hypothetical protein T492DRAFT_834084 [Pavlovales sp. CCMP2436]|nr:hypothetical protein T492DRAFT_834084 [Pavlovales sp. CCMP2436]